MGKQNQIAEMQDKLCRLKNSERFNREVLSYMRKKNWVTKEQHMEACEFAKNNTFHKFPGKKGESKNKITREKLRENNGLWKK